MFVIGTVTIPPEKCIAYRLDAVLSWCKDLLWMTIYPSYCEPSEWGRALKVLAALRQESAERLEQRGIPGLMTCGASKYREGHATMEFVVHIEALIPLKGEKLGG